MLKRRQRSGIDHPAGADRTWIRARCRDCGEVRFRSSLVRLHVDAGSGTAHMSFPCPKCGLRSARSLPDPVVDQLRQAGVAVGLLTWPTEADEVHDGPPLNGLDAADFVRLLEQPGWEADLHGLR